MTDTQLFFDKLLEDRKKSAEVLNKHSMKGVKKSVIDKYSDQAHFVYELLQNADDVGATNVKFILNHKELIFIHNGTRHFSVTDPDKEGSDEKIGDINAITSIGQSTKESDKSTIGKFGVGFKAVFQYTNTPHVYDDEFKFKIVDFIVPERLSTDHQLRAPNETLFVFPFDIENTDPEKCFDDVKSKLQNLVFPTLFLRNLKTINMDLDGEPSEYSMEEQKLENKPLIASLINIFNNSKKNTFLKFTGDIDGLEVSICYEMDENGTLQQSVYPAFCFFPTKENTGLKFLVHAPFILTDSREGIKEADKHNHKMISALSDTIVSSILMMKNMKNPINGNRMLDETIYRIIPLKSFKLSTMLPFFEIYDRIVSLFLEQCVVPTKSSYVEGKNAYWTSNSDIPSLLSAESLQEITENERADWIISDKTISDNTFSWFAESVCSSILYDRDILTSVSSFTTSKNGFTDRFIKKQSSTWIMDFYGWVGKSQNRCQIASKLPLFLDQNWEAVPAFNNVGSEIIFLPNGAVGNYHFINDSFMNDENSLKLFKELGLKEPDAGSEIETILDEYQKNSGNKTDSTLHFERIFNYYLTAPRVDSDKMIEIIKKVGFKFKVLYNGNHIDQCALPGNLYFYDNQLMKYFGNHNVTFLDLESYEKEIEDNNELATFFEILGINKLPKLKKIPITPEEAKQCGVKAQSYSITAYKVLVDGLLEAVQRSSANEDKELSKLIWNILLKISQKEDGKLAITATGIADIRNKKRTTFTPLELSSIRLTKWIVGKDGEFIHTYNTNTALMNDSYDLLSPYVKDVSDFLRIEVSNYELDSNTDKLSDEQKKAVDLYKTFLKSGVTMEELNNFFESQKNKQSQSQTPTQVAKNNSFNDSEIDILTNDDTEPVKQPDKSTDHNYPNYSNSGNSNTLTKKHEPLVRFREDSKPKTKKYDVEDYNKETIKESDLLKRAKEKYDAEITLITRKEELHSIAEESGIYTYRWFKALLELEYLNDPYSDSHELSIHFGKMERESDSIILLRNPNKPIPLIIEEVTGFPLDIIANGINYKIIAESASVHSFVLRVKTVSYIPITNLNDVSDICISIQNPEFLYESLTERFLSLNLEDSYNFQSSLNQDVRFIFGPPGTGKTTALSKLVVDEINSTRNGKILIVTPTNKAADVITERIASIIDEKETMSYLVRFGNTSSSFVESNGLLKDRSFNIDRPDKVIFVTTIARFYYDHVSSYRNLRALDEIQWDAIIIDEASMVRLIDIIYVMKKAEDSHFIISGDPFQIEPIVNEEAWENENIYSITGLNKIDSFTNPKTIPHRYKIDRLTTQYRSIPEIGRLYSNLTYGGLLDNARSNSDQLPLRLDSELASSNINLIKFPVKQYESIYRSKRLEGGSCYHIYSALLCLEFVKHLNKKIKESNPNKNISIGVISPYRVQADLVEKMVNRDIGLESGIHVGTIHGFQGDECDIIILLLNTPPRITNSSRLSVNKLNIINVAISRARDYLYIMMPDEETHGVENLAIINKLIRCAGSNGFKEIKSSEIEQLIFHDETYIEKNTYSTSHQNVNIYSSPEMVYEVRSDESSIDIQIHRQQNMTYKD